MGFQVYEQRSKKIYWANESELFEQVNAIGAAGNMKMTISECMPDRTTTDRCSLINYWIHTNNMS